MIWRLNNFMNFKNNYLKRFFNTSIVFFVGTVLTKTVSFFLLPLYTKYLDPATFGNYDLILSIINLAVPLAFFQIWDGMFRFAFDENDDNWKKKTITNSMVISIFGSIVYIVIQFLISIIYPDFGGIYVYLYGVSLGFTYIFTVSSRIYLDNKLFALSGVVNTVINAISNIILIKYLNYGVDALYISFVIGSLAQIILIEFKLHIFSKIKISLIDKCLINQLIKFSLPLCISTITYWLLSGFTKVMVVKYLGAYDNGLYAVANKFSSIIILVVNVFQFAWNELIYTLTKNKNNNKIYDKGLSIVIRITLYGTGMFIIFSKIIYPYFVDKSYYAGEYLLPISIIGLAFNSLASFEGTLFLAKKESKLLFRSTIYAAFFNVLSCSICIGILGCFGAILSLTISFAINAINRFYNLNKNIEYKVFFKGTCVLIAGVLSFYYINSNIINILIIIIFIFILLFEFKEEIKKM